jgi:hypothetical protein
MRKSIFVGIVLTLLASCSSIPEEVKLTTGMSESVRSFDVLVDPKTGNVFDSNDLGPQATQVGICTFRVEFPHRSSFNTSEVKANASGTCPAASLRYYMTAWVSLQREEGSLIKVWNTKATGPQIQRLVSGVGAKWLNNELVSAAPCVSGIYRSFISFRAVGLDGSSLAIPFSSPYSSPTSVTC